MIISVRGTSGSGKSHLVRRVVALYTKHRDLMAPPRVKPLYTLHGRTVAGKCLVTPGHYQIANGGIDTLKSLDEAYEIARWAARSGHDVIMEGKNMSDGVARVNELVAEKFEVRVVVLNTDVATCLRDVRKRGHRIAEKSIKKTYDKVHRDAVNFHCETVVGDRDACFEVIRRWLGPHDGDE
jgi:hypothetical protein